MGKSFASQQWNSQTLKLKQIFTYDIEEKNGIPCFIQPTLDLSKREELKSIITIHGGLIQDKIPIRGLIFFDPKSESGIELYKEWNWDSRPRRFFLSASYVYDCVEEGRLLSIDDYVIDLREKRIHDHTAFRNDTAEAGDIIKKLAEYLAENFPHHKAGVRASNKVYQDLVQIDKLKDWTRDYNWRTLRNHYCRHKQFYNSLIEKILEKKRHSQSQSRAPKASKTPLGDIKNTLTARGGNKLPKTVNFNKTERVATRRSKSRAKVPLQDTRNGARGRIDDTQDVEHPRHEETSDTGKDHLGLWLEAGGIEVSDNNKVFTGIDVFPEADKSLSFVHSFQFSPANSKCSPRATRSEFSAADNMDTDDWRSYRQLMAAEAERKENEVDESVVLQLLEPSEGFSAKTQTGGCPADTFCCTAPKAETISVLSVTGIAATHQFTAEEVSEKLAGFSGDLDKTDVFFLRCRRAIDATYSEILEGRHSSTLGPLLKRR